MCGIVGQLAFGELNEKEEKIRQESMIFLGSELLQMTQERGKDATGVSLLFDSGNYIGLKMGVPSLEFLGRFGKSDKEYGGFLKIWRKNTARVFLGHCRKGTGGDPLDNNNNHPIKVGDIVGIHNGSITNDHKIFKNLGCERSGKVDSEAIFRLLHHYTKNGTEPFTIDMIQEVVDRLTGQFAVLAFSGNNPYQLVAFRDGRPIEFAFIKPLKLVVIASEKKLIDTAIFRYNKYTNLYSVACDFPTLTASDVEFKALQDDSAVIFDLRTKVKKKIELGDLYDWEKMLRVNKKWGTAVSSYHAGNSAHKKTGTPAGALSTIPNRTGAAARGKNSLLKSTTETDKKPGRIWSDADKKFVGARIDKDGVEGSKEKKNVKVELSTGKVIDASGPALNEATKETIDGVISGPALVNEIEVAKEEEMAIVEVNTFVDPDALEKSEEATKKEERYGTKEEVLIDLEIQDEKTLEVIPLTALANRIKKFIFKRGFYKGYVMAKGSNRTKTTKGAAAEKNIRTLKMFVKMLLNIIRFSSSTYTYPVEKGVTQACDRKEIILLEDFDKLFKVGDLRNEPILEEIRYKVIEKGKR